MHTHGFKSNFNFIIIFRDFDLVRLFLEEKKFYEIKFLPENIDTKMLNNKIINLNIQEDEETKITEIIKGVVIDPEEIP